MTLRELAEELAKTGVEVSEPQLSKIERGLHTPHPGLRKALADMLDLDIDLQTVEVKS